MFYCFFLISWSTQQNEVWSNSFTIINHLHEDNQVAQESCASVLQGIIAYILNI